MRSTTRVARTGLLRKAGGEAPLARLLVEECQRDRGEKRRAEDVVVRETGKDREGVTALRPALAHPAAVAQPAIEQVEHFHIVARRGPVGVSGTQVGGLRAGGCDLL